MDETRRRSGLPYIFTFLLFSRPAGSAPASPSSRATSMKNYDSLPRAFGSWGNNNNNSTDAGRLHDARTRREDSRSRDEVNGDFFRESENKEVAIGKRRKFLLRSFVNPKRRSCPRKKRRRHLRSFIDPRRSYCGKKSDKKLK